MTTEEIIEVAPNETLDLKVSLAIERGVMAATCVGVVPIPLVDLAGVAYVQMRMIRKLSELHGVEYSASRARNLITALIGGAVPALGAYPLFAMVRSIPVLGWTVGTGAASILAGASTYAVGQVVKNHLAKGGSLANINIEEAKSSFAQMYEAGKEKATSMMRRKSKQAPVADEPAEAAQPA